MKYFLVITAFFILGSCQKKNSNVKATEVPTDQLQGTPPPPAPPLSEPPAPPPPEPPAPPVVVLPTLSFGYDEYTYQVANEINIELLLSQASKVPVVVEVELVAGTAIFGRDYAGFASGGGDPRKLSIVFPPMQTRFDLPTIIIDNGAECGGEFTAQLSGVQQAVITKDSTQIKITCK